MFYRFLFFPVVCARTARGACGAILTCPDRVSRYGARRRRTQQAGAAPYGLVAALLKANTQRSALRARSTPNTAAAVTTAILGGAERASGADGQPGATSQRQAHERQDAHERPGPAHVIGRATVS